MYKGSSSSATSASSSSASPSPSYPSPNTTEKRIIDIDESELWTKVFDEDYEVIASYSFGELQMTCELTVATIYETFNNDNNNSKKKQEEEEEEEEQNPPRTVAVKTLDFGRELSVKKAMIEALNKKIFGCLMNTKINLLHLKDYAISPYHYEEGEGEEKEQEEEGECWSENNNNNKNNNNNNKVLSVAHINDNEFNHPNFSHPNLVPVHLVFNEKGPEGKTHIVSEYVEPVPDSVIEKNKRIPSSSSKKQEEEEEEKPLLIHQNKKKTQQEEEEEEEQARQAAAGGVILTQEEKEQEVKRWKHAAHYFFNNHHAVKREVKKEFAATNLTSRFDCELLEPKLEKKSKPGERARFFQHCVKKNAVTESVARRFFVDLIEAFAYIHFKTNCGLVHFEKTNVLFRVDRFGVEHLVLSDCFISEALQLAEQDWYSGDSYVSVDTVLYPPDRICTSLTGLRKKVAPSRQFAFDCYLAGQLLFFFLEGRFAFACDRSWEKMRTGEFFFNVIDPESQVADLIHGLFDVEADRYDLATVFEHPWVRTGARNWRGARRAFLIRENGKSKAAKEAFGVHAICCKVAAFLPAVFIYDSFKKKEK